MKVAAVADSIMPPPEDIATTRSLVDDRSGEFANTSQAWMRRAARRQLPQDTARPPGGAKKSKLSFHHRAEASDNATSPRIATSPTENVRLPLLMPAMGTPASSRHVEVSDGVENLRDDSDEDSDSVHDEKWSDNYYKIADDYKHLVNEVAAISQ